MTTVLAVVLAIYAISLCAVVALFAHALLRERPGSGAGLGAVIDLAPSVAEQVARTDVPPSAKSA